jgi:lysozyme family protein
MASFDSAIDYVLANEGGLANAAGDVGGVTNFGISQSTYPNVDIRSLTRDDAKAIYAKDYWRYDQITSQRVATKLFDAHVNMGPVRAVRLMQLALGAIEVGPIVADGIIGSMTIEAINAADEERLVDEFKAQLVKYYCELSQSMPQFLLGWLRRAVKG